MMLDKLSQKYREAKTEKGLSETLLYFDIQCLTC